MRKHVAAVDVPLSDIRPLEPPARHGIKPVRYGQFVGSFREMQELHSVLHETLVVRISGAIGQVTALAWKVGRVWSLPNREVR
jgi:hypothetical protein